MAALLCLIPHAWTLAAILLITTRCPRGASLTEVDKLHGQETEEGQENRTEEISQENAGQGVAAALSPAGAHGGSKSNRRRREGCSDLASSPSLFFPRGMDTWMDGHWPGICI